MSDLISRKAARNAVRNLGEDYVARLKMLLLIEELPSAEPERKKGHWTGDCCSCCGVSKYNYIKMVDDECGPFGTWNFCPHCGADMRGENEKA